MNVLLRVWSVIQRPQVWADAGCSYLNRYIYYIFKCFDSISPNVKPNPAIRGSPSLASELQQPHRHIMKLETRGLWILINVNVSHMAT